MQSSTLQTPPSIRKTVTIYTDGACKGNPGIGGWGAILLYGDQRKNIHGAMPNTTNNQMELMAVIEALKALKKPCTIDLYTDSKYVQQGMLSWLSSWKQKNWKKADNKPIKNLTLWQELDRLTQAHHIRWHWVKGHAGDPLNEAADALANLAIEKYKSL